MSTLLYLLGSGRSGSTLLDWLLDCHPAAIGLGEIGYLPEVLFRGRREARPCACGEPLPACPLWGPLVREALATGAEGGGFDDWNRALLARAAAFRPGVEVLVDSSCWLPRLQRLLASPLAAEHRVRVLYLTRDARGVAHSVVARGYHGSSFRPSLPRALLSWRRVNARCVRFLRTLPREQYLHLTYEEFCRRPRESFAAVQRFAGLAPAPLPADWKARPHHTFAGNKGLRRGGPAVIVEDRSWAAGLGGGALLLTELLTGRLNRRLLSGRALPPPADAGGT